MLYTAYAKQFYPKPVVPMESQNSEDMPFAIRSVCDQAFGRYRPLKGAKNGHVTITKIENLHIDTRRKIHLFQKCYSFRSTTKMTEIFVENRFRRLWCFQHATILEWSTEVGFSLILSIYKVVYINTNDLLAGYAAMRWRNLLLMLPKTEVHYAIKDSYNATSDQ